MEDIIKPMPKVSLSKEAIRDNIATQEFQTNIEQFSANMEVDIGSIYAKDQAIRDATSEFEASTLDKIDAVFKTAYQHSPAAKAISTFAIEQLTSTVTKRQDPEFMAGNNTDYKMARLTTAGLPISSYATTLLAGAKNKDDFDFFLSTLKVDKELASNAKFLTSGQQQVSMFTGLMADPTYLAYAPVKLFSALQGGIRLSSVMGSNMALQYTLSKARDYGEPNRTTDDMLLDVAFGGIFDSFFAMKALGKLDESFAATLAGHHAQSKDFSAVINDLQPQRFDFSQNYTWSSVVARDTIKEDVTVASVVEKYKPTRKPMVAKPKVDTPKEILAKQKQAESDITTYHLAKKEELATAIAKSGLSEQTYMDIYNNLASDVTEIKSLIKSISGESKVYIDSVIKDISAGLETMGKVSPSAKAQIENEIKNVLGHTIQPTPIIKKTGKELAYDNGFRSFKKKVKQFDVVIKNKIDEVKKAFKEVTDFKALKPLVKELDAKESALLTKTQAKMDKIEIDINAKAKAGVDEIKLQKLHDEHAKLADVETSLLHKLESFKTAKEKSTLGLLGKQKELYQRMASVMDELVHEINDSFKTIFADSLSTPAEKALFKKELQRDLSNILGQEIRIVEKDGSFIVKGDIKFDVKGDMAIFKGNKVMLATLLALGGSSAVMADDGSGITISDAWFFIIMAATGIYGLKAVKSHGGLNNTIKTMGNKMAGVQKLAIFSSSDKTKALMESKDQIVDAANMGAINSIEVIMKNGNADSKSLGQRLGFDAVNPQKIMSAMVRRLIGLRDDVRIFREAEEVNFKAWLGEQNLKETFMDRLMESGAETLVRERFLNEVTDMVEYGKSASNSKHVSAQAKVMSEVMGNTASKAIAMKIVGFTEDIIGKTKNYVPRIPLYDNIRAIASASPEAMKDLALNIGRAIAKTNGTPSKEVMDLADSLVDGYLAVGVHSVQPQKIRDILNAMDKAGFDISGINAEELATTIRSNNDAISRGKFRLDMDMSYFKPFEYTVNGETHLATQSIIYERNAGTLLQQHSSQIHGAIALKESTKGLTLSDGSVIKDGIESEYGVRQLISKELNVDVKEVLDTYVDAIMGHPLYASGSMANRIVSTLRDLAYSRLALTQFAMSSEYATALAHMLHNNAAMRQGISHLSNLLKSIFGMEGGNTALSSRIAQLNGLGTSVIRRESSFKNIEGMYNASELEGKSLLEKLARGVKYISLIATRILHADDALKRIAGVYHTDNLVKLLDGKMTMSANRMERFGIDKDFFDTFRGKFKMNGKELADDFDAGWTKEMRETYGNIVHRMIMTDSPEAIVSSLPQVTSTSSAGRLVGLMTNFTAQSFTTKALAGMKRPDALSFVETSIYFMGTYAGIYARDLAKGKEPDNEDIMYRAIMMMPLTAPYGMLSMMSDPMSTSIVPDTFMQMDRIRKDLVDE